MTYAAALRAIAETLLRLADELERTSGRVLCAHCKRPAHLGLMAGELVYHCRGCGGSQDIGG